MKAILLVVFALSASLAASGQDKCFENNGLKDSHVNEMTINGKTVTGSLGIAPDFDEERVMRYEFTGIVSGSRLSVKFSDKTPDALPASPLTKTWTLIGTGSGQKLRVTLFGKNYNTNKWSNYTVDYRSCRSPYDEAASTAKRVSFARGATSATMLVNFTSKGEKQNCVLNLRSGQRASVAAPGCGISFFYPDKTAYDEGTAIDTLVIYSLTQSGDYLFVISPAGEPGPCRVTFEAR